MEIFHYVSNQLVGIPIFECENTVVCDAGEGAVYNDFDFDPATLISDDINQSQFSFSQSSSINMEARSNTQIVPQEDIDHAVLEADWEQGVLYDYTAFDTPFFDCTSESADDAYMENVYTLLTTHEWRKCTMEGTLEVFAMRLRSNWHGPDTVYDAWLLSNNERRKWFPYKKFIKKYPHWEKKRLQIFAENNPEEESDNDSEIGCNKRSKRQKCFVSDSDSEVDIVVKKETLFSGETIDTIIEISSDEETEEAQAKLETQPLKVQIKEENLFQAKSVQECIAISSDEEQSVLN